MDGNSESEKRIPSWKQYPTYGDIKTFLEDCQSKANPQELLSLSAAYRLIILQADNFVRNERNSAYYEKDDYSPFTERVHAIRGNRRPRTIGQGIDE